MSFDLIVDFTEDILTTKQRYDNQILICLKFIKINDK